VPMAFLYYYRLFWMAIFFILVCDIPGWRMEEVVAMLPPCSWEEKEEGSLATTWVSLVPPDHACGMYIVLCHCPFWREEKESGWDPTSPTSHFLPVADTLYTCDLLGSVTTTDTDLLPCCVGTFVVGIINFIVWW